MPDSLPVVKTRTRNRRSTPRPQPVRDAIVSFVDQPRSVGQIADHIGRPVPTTTGHLNAMAKRGLVHRVGRGTYVPAAYTGPDMRLPQRRSESPRNLRDQILELLRERCTVRGLYLKLGLPEAPVRMALHDLKMLGFAVGNDLDGYMRARWIGKNQ